MVDEVQRALEEATKRFNETATAMRSTAREVGSELEATRTELARGVMELPEETRASAAAMRRVVAEQISALSELNDIVRAQSAGYDVSEHHEPARPAPQPPKSSRPEPEPARPEPQPARPDPSPFRYEPQAERQEAPRQASRGESTNASRQPTVDVPPPAPMPLRVLAPPSAAASPQPQQAPPASPPLGAVPSREDTGGWLRDVLRNASAKQAAAAHAPGTFSSLTQEIVRAIDAKALTDAWTHYQAGEANAFSRRIYTLPGQGTYDEVRKKLQRDPEFARTAQAYMAEFEQLLKRAAAGPRPVEEARDYLLSDRGRVYTMLAHASGRLN
jgi:hypothetical protein